MTYRTPGRTGIQVSAYALGAMMFGASGNPDHDDSVRIIRTALDAGINFIDTAEAYSNGESEEIVGKALKGCRDSVVLATKAAGRPRAGSPVHAAPGNPNRQGASRPDQREVLLEVLDPECLERSHRLVVDMCRARTGHRHPAAVDDGDPEALQRPVSIRPQGELVGRAPVCWSL